MIKNEIKIGFVTYQNERPDLKIASTRIRVTWAAKYAENFIISEDIKELENCRVVVFQTRFSAGDIKLAEQLKQKGIKIALDLTDPHWLKEYGGTCPQNLIDMAGIADVITFPTDNLRNSFLEVFPNKRTAIVSDRLDLELYDKVKKHTKKNKFKILWHGSFGNRGSIDLAREDLEELGQKYDIELVCVYDNSHEYNVIPFANIKLSTHEWSNEKVIEELLNSDLSINPRYDNWKSYKSNNKTITAWALGIPCVEKNFYKEIKAYLDSHNLRNADGRELRELVLKHYDVKDTAREWIKIADELTAVNEFKRKKKKKIAVYTAICGGYDGLREDNIIDDEADYIAYVDSDVYSYVWDVRQIYKQFLDPMREAKIYKVLPWQYLDDYEYSIWMDGTIAIKSHASHLINNLLNGYDMAVFKHARRDCIYDEFIADMEYRKREPMFIREAQREKYIKEGIPTHIGLWECGILIRRHTDKVKALCNEWWSEISSHSASDQCSFARTVYKHKFNINLITPGDMYGNPYFKYIPHANTWAYTMNSKAPENTNEAKSEPERILSLNEIEPTKKVKIKRVVNETFHSHDTGRLNLNDVAEIDGAFAAKLIKDYPGAFIVIN